MTTFLENPIGIVVIISQYMFLHSFQNINSNNLNQVIFEVKSNILKVELNSLHCVTKMICDYNFLIRTVRKVNVLISLTPQDCVYTLPLDDKISRLIKKQKVASR